MLELPPRRALLYVPGKMGSETRLQSQWMAAEGEPQHPAGGIYCPRTAGPSRALSFQPPAFPASRRLREEDQQGGRVGGRCGVPGLGGCSGAGAQRRRSRNRRQGGTGWDQGLLPLGAAIALKGQGAAAASGCGRGGYCLARTAAGQLPLPEPCLTCAPQALAELSFGRSERAVRINSVQSGHCEDDLEAVLSGAALPDALVVPKVYPGLLASVGMEC